MAMSDAALAVLLFFILRTYGPASHSPPWCSA
jgi:hypothetical protein